MTSSRAEYGPGHANRSPMAMLTPECARCHNHTYATVPICFAKGPVRPEWPVVRQITPAST
jgi:hypothetical protein